VAGNNSSQYRYKHYKFCKKCNEWLPREYVTCPSCGSHLRGTPRRAYCRRHYRNSRKYSPADAQRIFERFLGRGYSVEEAAEATLAITGLRPAIRVLAGGLEKALAED
jgi:predicted amidophosphoribosyltransferase